MNRNANANTDTYRIGNSGAKADANANANTNAMTMAILIETLGTVATATAHGIANWNVGTADSIAHVVADARH